VIPGARTLDRPTLVKTIPPSGSPGASAPRDGVIMFLRLDNVIDCVGYSRGEGSPVSPYISCRAIRVVHTTGTVA
jgi:hypothetical protein